MLSQVKKSAAAIVAIVLITMSATSAHAVCVSVFPVTITPSAATIPDYDPFSPTDTTLNVTFTFAESLLAVCQAAVSFTRTAGLPALMAQGSSTLQYSIETTGGQTLMQTTGFVANTSPAVSNRADFLLPILGSIDVTARIRIPAGQLVASGIYSDANVNLTLVALGPVLGSAPQFLIKQQPFVPSVNVVSKCVLPTPSSTTLDFTSAISLGNPDPSVVKNSTFSNVRCTAPSVLRLSGTSMQPIPPVSAATGFDNFINWRAVGTFGNASTTLNTTSQTQATSASKNVASGITSNGTIGVDVNLVSGNPIVAGTYKSTITVTIDPNL